MSGGFLRSKAPMLGDAIKGTPVILVICGQRMDFIFSLHLPCVIRLIYHGILQCLLWIMLNTQQGITENSKL